MSLKRKQGVRTAFNRSKNISLALTWNLLLSADLVFWGEVADPKGEGVGRREIAKQNDKLSCDSSMRNEEAPACWV